MIFDCLDEVRLDDVVEYVAGLQQEDGSFMGDQGNIYYITHTVEYLFYSNFLMKRIIL